MTAPLPEIAGATVLVVDDNPTNLNVLVDYLRGSGFKILIARDGEAALQRTALTRPDLILLDVMMPGLDGFEVCRRLQAQPALREIPVIFMTALASTDDKVRGFEAGAVDYVTKPVQQAEVLARVTTHLRLRTATRQLQAANTALAAANVELAEANATKDKFFSIIAHDLRAPFDALINFPELMLMQLERMEPERMREMLERMQRTARNTYELLQNLLTWARLQRGLLTVAPEPMHLKLLADRTVAVLGEVARKKEQTLTNTIAAPVLVYADKSMVETILRNLVSNAIKFTPTGGHITLAARATPEQVQLSVTDTGVGLTPVEIELVFRLDAKHSTRGTADERGTGLGLLLCREMAQKNGGALTLTSTVGQGTTVTVTLPAPPP